MNFSLLVVLIGTLSLRAFATSFLPISPAVPHSDTHRTQSGGPRTLNGFKLSIINQCLSYGIDKAHKLDLKKLQTQIANIPFQSVSSLTGSPAPDRRHAFYLNGKVYFDENIQTSFPSALELLALHEGLGALGFRDQDYQISILLHALCSNPNPEKRQELLESSLLRWHLGATQLAGGTKIGGGGDWEAALLKLDILKSISEGKTSVSHSILVAELKIEPSPFASRIKLVVSEAEPHIGLIRWTLKQGNTASLYPRFTVLIPSSKSVLDQTDRHALLHFFKAYFRIIEEGSPAQSIASCGNVSLISNSEMLTSHFWSDLLNEQVLAQFQVHCKEIHGDDAEQK